MLNVRAEVQQSLSLLISLGRKVDEQRYPEFNGGLTLSKGSGKGLTELIPDDKTQTQNKQAEFPLTKCRRTTGQHNNNDDESRKLNSVLRQSLGPSLSNSR